ncbi:MAG: dienelactone hydrolase family protein [Clostridia bacterium]
MSEHLLAVPQDALGVVVFSHGSGSGRLSPRNQFVAAELRRSRIATLLLDLLTPAEDRVYENRFDIALLTTRLGDAVRLVRREAATRALPVGLFGASTGAASALRVAAAMPEAVRAVVSRGGRPDLTGDEMLARVQAPTLLIVGGLDDDVLEMNRSAQACLRCPSELAVVPGATHLFEEAGTLEQVARLAARWFARYLGAAAASAIGAA